MKEKASGLKLINYAGYGAGSIGTALVSVVIQSYLTIYLTNVALLDIAAVSAIIGMSKIFDGVSDIIIGKIVDNTRSRLGRARAWLLRICIPLSAAMFLLFHIPPQLQGFVRYVYVFIMYNLVNAVFMTFMNIADMSLISLMTRDRREHGLLANMNVFARSIGVLIGSSLFVKLLSVFTDRAGEPNTQRGYAVSVLIFCIIMVAANLFKVFTTKETEEVSTAPKEKRILKDDLALFRIILTDKYWLILFIVQLLLCLSMPIATTGAAYYATYTLGDMSQLSWIMATHSAPASIVLCITPFLISRFDGGRLFKAGALIYLVGALGFGLVAPAKAGMIVFNIIKGFGFGIFTCMIFALTADVTEMIRKKTGMMAAGVSFAGLSAGDKLGNGLGSVVFGLVMSAAGFSGELKVQPPAVAAASSWMFIWSQVIILAVIAVILLKFFDIDKATAEDGTA